jgi:hypothetical protein
MLLEMPSLFHLTLRVFCGFGMFTKILDILTKICYYNNIDTMEVR